MNFLSGFIAIIGPPNVGKSTLLNQILGEKVAIVSPKPQTTRNRIMGILHGEGYQMVFVDTPGIHKTKTALHQSMVDSAFAAFHEVDILMIMIEMDRPDDLENSPVIANLKGIKKLCFLVINKIDKGSKQNLLPLISKYSQKFPFEAILPISALTGDGVPELLGELKSKLKSGPQFFPEDMETDQTESFIVSEIIREKIYFHVREELPYSSAVTVLSMEDIPGKDLISIEGVIHVETPSQKGILIGKGGTMIKAIGRSARKELETRFNARVYLGLTVRVEKNWSKDARALRRLGY